MAGASDSSEIRIKREAWKSLQVSYRFYGELNHLAFCQPQIYRQLGYISIISFLHKELSFKDLTKSTVNTYKKSLKKIDDMLAKFGLNI